MRPHTATCFVCGPDNPGGLHLRFVRDGNVVRARTTLPPEREGAPGLAHGGIVTSILDDLCAVVPRMLGERAVTARLELDFAAPVVIGRALDAEAWLESFEGRKIRLVARLLDGDRVLATGRALFLTVPREHFAPRDGATPPTVGP